MTPQTVSVRSVFKKIALTGIARGGAGVGVVVLGVVVSRVLGVEGLGIFAIAQATLLGAAIISRYGYPNALIRFCGRTECELERHWFLTRSLKRVAWNSVLVMALLLLLAPVLANVFSRPHLIAPIMLVAGGVVPFAICFVLAGFLKSVDRPVAGTLLENGAVSLVSVLLMGVAYYLFPQFNITVAVGVFTVACWLVLALGVATVIRRSHNFYGSTEEFVGGERGRNSYSLKYGEEFDSVAKGFFYLSLAQFVQQVLGVYVAGYFLEVYDLGLLKAAERIAYLISFVLLVINAVLPRHFAALYQQRKMAELQRLARMGSFLGLVVTVPLISSIFLFPESILGVFGNGFEGARSALFVLAFAQFVNVVAGSNDFLLGMTGNERIIKNIALACSVIGVFLIGILAYFFGLVGAAVGAAAAVILQNAVATYYVYVKLGLLVFPWFERQVENNESS